MRKRRKRWQHAVSMSSLGMSVNSQKVVFSFDPGPLTLSQPSVEDQLSALRVFETTCATNFLAIAASSETHQSCSAANQELNIRAPLKE